MKFTKMQGCGNDYVYINCFEERVDNPSELAIRLSNRNFGIGSDGLVLIEPSECADFFMSMYNADGSRGKMCGNAIRCVGKYVYDNKLTDKTRLTIDTLAGIKQLELFVEKGKVSRASVDMGKPVTEAKRIPVISEYAEVIDKPYKIDGTEYRLTCVSMGNPHCVVYLEDVKDLKLCELGPKFEHNPMFPERINTEFVRIIDRANIEMRVWERGSGETLACGTGACACAYASMLNGYTEDTVTVHMLGGELLISFYRDSGRIYMQGPAVKSFEGEIDK